MLPPGPKTPAFWQTLRYATDPRGYSLAMMRKHGPVIRFRALNGRGVVVNDAETARLVFAADPALYDTPPVLSDLFGPFSLIATAGEVHKRQRRLLNPRFHGQRIKAFLATIERVVRAHLEPLRGGGAVVMADLGQAIALDVILETVFGADPQLDRAEARATLIGLVRALSPTFIFAKPMRTPLFPPWRAFMRRRAAFDAWVDRSIAARRSGAAPGADILGMLLDARYDDGSAMSDAEIRDQLMTLLVAGHETTAIALAWGVYWLARHPPVLARVREERARRGDAGLEAIVRAPYLGAVIAETLRIEPIVTEVDRVCREPFALRDWVVPAGEIIIVNVCCILADPALFPAPHVFRPERFLERSFSGSEFLPFGGGSRRCLGAAFAEAELGVALSILACEWDVELASDEPERSVRRNITMGPAKGVPVRVVGPRATGRRSGAAA